MASVRKAATQKAMSAYGAPVAQVVSTPQRIKKKVCSGVRIEVAANGFTATKHYRYEGDGMYPDTGSEKEHVFTDPDAVLAFVKKAIS